MSDDEKMAAMEFAHVHATELDKARWKKIIHWRGDGDLVMSLPQWVMSIFNRSADEET